MNETGREWYTDDFPELRAGPPWIMEEMILAEPALVDPILGADGPDVAALRGAVAAAAGDGAPVVVTGCGTSEHAALAVAGLITDAYRRAGSGNRAEARQALDAALDPRAGGLCIAISHDGGTRATGLALDAARSRGATTALVTANPAAPLAAFADHIIVTPVHDDSWCHTLAYTSAIVAGASIASPAAPDAETRDAAREAIETTIARRAEFDAAAASLGHPGRIVTAGLGVDSIAARELALKIEEGARRPAGAHHLETLLHGHLAGCDAASTSLVLFALDPRGGARRDRRLALAARAAAAIGIPTLAIGSPAALDALPDGGHTIELDPPGAADPLLTGLLLGTVSLQLLTLALVHLAGTNPDLIRREEAAYREAARIADDTPDW